MLILLTIFLFLFIPLVMLIMHVIWPRINIQGFLAILAALAGWILIFIARPDIARSIPLLQWQPASVFLFSPELLIDNTSWYFSLALGSLALSVVITSIAQVGQSALPVPEKDQKSEVVSGERGQHAGGIRTDQGTESDEGQPTSGWLLWIVLLTLTSLGLLAVTSGNLLTIFLSWTALDIIELLILLGQIQESKIRERIILVFSAKLVGSCFALIAGIMLWSHGSTLLFEAITPSIGTFLVLATGLRLGVLPLHIPFTKGLAINRNLGTALRLIPTAANFVLLVRVSSVGVTGVMAPIMLGVSIFAGSYAAISWLRAKNEIVGRPYWLIGTSSLVVIAALLHQPIACLAWGIASLLSGGLIFSMSIRHKNLLPIILLGILNLSALPFSPTWRGTGIYQFYSSLGINLTSYAIFSLFFLFIQAFLFAGYIRHCLFGIYPTREIASSHTERWVWILHPLGLIIICLTHFWIGWLIYPNLREVGFSDWLIGPISLLITGLILYFVWRFPPLYHPEIEQNLRTTWDRFLSLEWLYRSLWRLFRTLLRIFSFVSMILEGDGGLLWALVLFGLIFVFMQQ